MRLQLDYSLIVIFIIILAAIGLGVLVSDKFVIRRLSRQTAIYSGVILLTIVLTSAGIYIILQLQINDINANIGATKTAMTNIQGNVQATATSLEATLLPFRIETAVAATMQAAQIPTATAP